MLLRKVQFGEVGEIVGILQVRSSCISAVVFESAVVLFFPMTMLWFSTKLSLPIMNKEVPDILVTAGIDLSQELQFCKVP